MRVLKMSNYGHLLAAFFQILGFYLKSRGYHLSQKIVNCAVYICYLTPVLAGCVCLRDVYADFLIAVENGDAEAKIPWTQLRRWLLIEQFMFLGMVVSGIFFLMSAVNDRMLSIWNENKKRFIVTKDGILLNVWARRGSMDFLHYLKFEFIQSTLFGGFFFVSILVWWIGDNVGVYNIGGFDWEEINSHYKRANITFGMADLLTVFMMRFLLSQATGGKISQIRDIVYYGIAGGIAVAILILKLQTSIELLIDVQYNRVFI